MAKKPFSYKKFKEIYSEVPRLCVDLVIKTPDGIALTLRKLSSWNNMWHLPGSTVYYGESLNEAVSRTAKEEVGIGVKIEKLSGFIEYSDSEKKERGFGWTISLVFICSPTQTQMKPNKEASEVKIFKELPKNIIPEQATFIIKNKLL